MEGSVATLRVERRLRARYPVQLPARYRTLDQKVQLSGIGLTVNLSSGSLLVTCQHEIKPGFRMEVQVDWPSLLESTIPLQLVTDGRVIRSEPSAFAIEFARYEFRTIRRKPLPGPFALPNRAATARESGYREVNAFKYL
ncbi:MAG TPA: PilZ domain-containing protein [Bryobacteraceae bacterium]|nr:PilZ domain-containing protein [Bryobacteraceae bacterium]